jgi:hypothetical protein
MCYPQIFIFNKEIFRKRNIPHKLARKVVFPSQEMGPVLLSASLVMGFP